jgi:hypothetical protein
MAASSVESVLSISILKIVISAVEVATSPEQSGLSPPTVSRTQTFYFLWGLKSQTIFP